MSPVNAKKPIPTAGAPAVAAEHRLAAGESDAARQGFLSAMERSAAFGDRSAEVESTLSPRQLNVARLLMEGCTNKEIAARPYLSTRTIEMHVVHLFDRLNCRTRTEAARQPAEHGLRA